MTTFLGSKFGETTITTEPKRVVTAGLKEQEHCLALGVVPVASTTWFYLCDGVYEACSFITLLSVRYLLEGLIPRMKAAIDGDLKTSSDPG